MKCMGLMYSREIAVDDEGDADVGDVLLAAGRPIGVIDHLRAHGQRPGWSVFRMNRPLRGMDAQLVYRGDALTVAPST